MRLLSFAERYENREMPPSARIVSAAFILFLEVHSESLADRLCSSATSDSLFCSSRKAQSAPNSSSTGDFFARLARETGDDPKCPTLREEYENQCFAIPPIEAIVETREFCNAFVEMCPNLLLTNLFTKIKGFRIDFTRYCKKHNARFEFVCPDPLRFHSYGEEAVDFCIRYKTRCPDAKVPSEPVPFQKKNTHIFTREIKQFCDKMLNFAANYCTNPDILKVPRYQLPCAVYKYQCVDIYTRVIYGR